MVIDPGYGRRMLPITRIVILDAVLALVLAACSSSDGGATASGNAKATAPTHDASWQQIEKWAAPVVAPGDPAPLDRALALLSPHRELVSERWHNHDPVCDDVELPTEVSQAVSALVAWHKAQGGVKRLDCPGVIGRETDAVLHMHILAQAALLLAPRQADHPNVEAALYLGHRLRREGTTLLHFIVGSTIANSTVDWAIKQGLQPAPAFSDLRPERDALIRALAAEAICQKHMAELFRNDQREYNDLRNHFDVELPQEPTQEWFDKEIAAVHTYVREMIARAHANRDDDVALATALEQHAERKKNDKQHVLLSVLAVSSQAEAVRQFTEHRQAHERYVTGARRDELTAAFFRRRQPCGTPENTPADVDRPARTRTLPMDDTLIAELDAGIRMIDDTHYVIDKTLSKRILSGELKVVRGARIVPAVKNGKPQGFRLYSIHPGSLYAKLGVRNGDTLRAVNGRALTTPDKTIEIFNDMKDSSQFELAIIRDNQPVVLTYDIQ